MNVSFVSRVYKMLIVFLSIMILIGACFGSIYGLDVVQRRLKKQIDDDLASVDNKKKGYEIRFLSFLVAFVIILINNILKWVVKYLTEKERHETYTAFNISIAIKLMLARFVNTAIVPVIINIQSDMWFNEGGLVSDLFSIMISISFIDPVL
jgi:hypothetical protein